MAELMKTLLALLGEACCTMGREMHQIHLFFVQKLCHGTGITSPSPSEPARGIEVQVRDHYCIYLTSAFTHIHRNEGI
jgi:hypothetical protein